jgi:hypothetical protein
VIRRTKVSSAGSNVVCAGGFLALLATALVVLGVPAAALAAGGTVHLDEPPTMGYATMTVTGEVKEDLISGTSGLFEVVEDPSEFNDGLLGNQGNDFSFQDGEDVRDVQHEFTGLKAGTTYYARLKTRRDFYTTPVIAFSNVVSGTTLPVPAPQVLSVNPASSVSYTSAHVEGEVEGVDGSDPAFASHCRFEYVPDAEYGAQNEVQKVTVQATGGAYRFISFNPKTSIVEETNDIPYDATAATMQAALEQLGTIRSGNVSVSGGPGDQLGTSPYFVTFIGGLAETDVNELQSLDSYRLEPSGESALTVQTVVAGQTAYGRGGSVPCSVDPVTTSGATHVEADLTDLKADTTYHAQLAISNAGGGDSEEAGTFTTLVVAPPVALGVDDASNVAYTQADLSAEVERPANPDPAFDVSCRFEYVAAESFLSSGFEFAAQVPCTEDPLTSPGANTVSAHLSGLSVNTTYYYRVVVTNAGGQDAADGANPFTTLTPDAPTVSIFPVDTIGAHSARFSGTINPGGTDPGFDVSWRFECNPACPGLEGFITADENDHEVSVEATGLNANTQYEVTLVTSNMAATASAGPVAFTTSTTAPLVATIPAFALVGGTEAFIAGTVDPENLATTYWIEYGTDESYGSSIPVTEDGDAGAGDEPVFIERKLTGLTPGAEYHFRVVAVNGAGTSAGQDKTFVTPTGDLGSSIGDLQLPEDRRWEMVSPPDKNGADVSKLYGVASPDGERLTYKSKGSFAGLETAQGATQADYIAQRTPSGWQSQGMTPRGGLFCLECGVVDVIEDLSGVRLNWQERAGESPDEDLEVNPDAKARVFRTYVRDTATGKFKLVPRPSRVLASGGGWESSSDGGQYAVETMENLSDQAPCDAEAIECVYESSDRGASWHLASILPDESPAGGSLIAMSQDGTRIYFRSGGDNYVRIDATSTLDIPGSFGTSVLGIEGGDGARALLLSSEQLLGADTDGGNDLYLWDGAAPEGERLTLISRGEVPGRAADVIGGVGFEEDALRIHDLDSGFFTAGNQVLEGEPSAAGQKIYAWSIEGGEPSLSYVATASISESRVSRNGRFLLFASTDRVTAYDNAGRQEVYRYDQGTDRLVCVSCQPKGKKPTAASHLHYFAPQETAFGPRHSLRNVTDDGLVFFESEESLAAHDSNGKRDVYEYKDGLPQLLSKGTGPHDSRFVDASASGDSVFFLTDDKLVGWDTDGSYDVYNARIGGGFPEPPLRPLPCEGDACQPAPVPPNDPTPASESFKGAGNVKPHKKKHCKKKAAKKCKKHKKQHKKRTGKSTKKNG